MTDTTEKKKKAFIISDFRDSGTEQNFKAGETREIPEGQFVNYEAAGLVRAPTAEDRAQASKPAA